MVKFLVGFACGIIMVGGFMTVLVLLQGKAQWFDDVPDNDPKWR